jgi:hypothetical protein
MYAGCKLQVTVPQQTWYRVILQPSGHRGVWRCRSGALVATAWASMRHLGVQGFQDAAKDIMRAVDAFRAAVAAEEELEVMGEPASTVVAFTSAKKGFNIHQARRCWPRCDACTRAAVALAACTLLRCTGSILPFRMTSEARCHALPATDASVD